MRVGCQILIDGKVIFLFVYVVQEVGPRTIMSGMFLLTLSCVLNHFYRPLLRGQNQIFLFVKGESQMLTPTFPFMQLNLLSLIFIK